MATKGKIAIQQEKAQEKVAAEMAAMNAKLDAILALLEADEKRKPASSKSTKA